MTGRRKPRSRIRRILGIIGSILSLAVLTYIAVMLISGRGAELLRFFDPFSKPEPVEFADEYYFDVGRRKVFADLDGSIAAAGTLGVQVLDYGGNEKLRDPVRMSAPAINSQSGRAVVFDVGGTAIRVVSGNAMVFSLETECAIVSASINRNGWVSVCTQNDGIYKGIAEVYKSDGSPAYLVRLATGYVLSSALSPDNKSLAVLNLTEKGSRISFYNLDSEEIDRAFELADKLILDIRYRSNGDVLVITSDSLLIVDKNNKSKVLYNFSGGRPGGFSLDGGYYALYLSDQGPGNRGKLITIKENGDILGEIVTNNKIISLSADENYLVTLQSDGVVVYDTSLKELPLSGGSVNPVGATSVLALIDGYILAAGDHTAVVAK